MFPNFTHGFYAMLLKNHYNYSYYVSKFTADLLTLCVVILGRIFILMSLSSNQNQR